MLRHSFLALGVSALTLLLATPRADPPLCRVQASSYPRPYLFDRQVIFSIRLPCPENGIARVRYASRLGGILPALPPGYLTLKPEQVEIKPLGKQWWIEWQSRSGQWWRVRENEGRP